MTKGSDSKEFFELFKKPGGPESFQRKEEKPLVKPKEEPAPPPVAEIREKKRPVAPADPLKWIKNTSKEGVSDKVKPESALKSYSAPLSSFTNEPSVRKDDVVLRQETLIISAIAATFLSIACFFVGYKVGYNKGAGLIEGGEEEQWMETTAPPAQKKVEHAPAKVAEVPQKPASKPAPQKTEKPPEPVPVKAVEAPQKNASKPAPQKVEKPVEPPKPAPKDSWTLRVVSYKNTRENVEKAKEVAKVIYDKLGLDAFVVSKEKDIFVCVGEYEGSDSSGLIHAQKALSELVYENKKQFEGCYPVRMR